jgi:hypoxanthine-guanine phosphoribosyltransferase
MKTSEKIKEYIKKKGEVSANELAGYLNITPRGTFKQLSNLLKSSELVKIGKPPKVFYKIRDLGKDYVKITIGDNFKKIINENFVYITPLGEYLEGLQGFVQWCDERDLEVNNQADQYVKIFNEAAKSKKLGVINSSEKFKKSFDEVFLKEVFFVDFYSIPQFGKTKLGQLLLYAKQSQDKKRIKEISQMVEKKIKTILKKYSIEAVGFIPPTVKREVQFMKELEKNLKIALPTVKISKVKTEIIVPQKTLSKMKDRIINAQNTIVIEEKKNFKNILLIDDAVGSGATFNETARKILKNDVAKNVYGVAVTGSFKGFDVISEV